MIEYSKVLHILRESAFSRDENFISELNKEVLGLLNEADELINAKIENISTGNIEKFEKQITELRFIKNRLVEILKVK